MACDKVCFKIRKTDSGERYGIISTIDRHGQLQESFSTPPSNKRFKTLEKELSDYCDAMNCRNPSVFSQDGRGNSALRAGDPSVMQYELGALPKTTALGAVDSGEVLV